ncbi:MAG: RHS repeat-associated core domain-containing protein, partial [Bacteroidales bacterium]|nr:RHS repeat-associated core domain-containing protein [Bacteroidales bacterium]
MGRFTTQNAYAEKYFSLSSYQYCANNPILLIDINGGSLFMS